MFALVKLLSIKTDTCNFQQVVSVRFESQILLYIGLNQAFQRFTPALRRNHRLALTAAAFAQGWALDHLHLHVVLDGHPQTAAWSLV